MLLFNPFSLLTYSWRKSAKLRRIGRVLDEKPDLRDFASGAAVMARQERLRAAQDELIDLVLGDRALAAVVVRCDSGREDLVGIIRTLQRIAPGWSGGHYVPVSSLAYVETLEYVLTHRVLSRAGFINLGEQLFLWFSAVRPPRLIDPEDFGEPAAPAGEAAARTT